MYQKILDDSGMEFGFTCEPTVIGRNPEMADMSNPQGDIWGRQYCLVVTLAGTSFHYRHHIGRGEEALRPVVEDLAFFRSIPGFHPARCAEFVEEEPHVPYWEA